ITEVASFLYGVVFYATSNSDLMPTSHWVARYSGCEILPRRLSSHADRWQFAIISRQLLHGAQERVPGGYSAMHASGILERSGLKYADVKSLWGLRTSHVRI